MQETFIDLDELILRCRDKASKKLIQEAVSCYRAGAYRSCIVATWNAVVFDFLHKLGDLKLSGDKEAVKQLEEFEKLINSKQFRELWQFESKIPERAQKNFELISIVEQSDIERLFEDRSRCAHPSMTSLEEPFEATAELARYHLRSAVTHLLSRPPVQGRAAKKRIFQEIKSNYFPIDPEQAIESFKEGPLARARFTLIKDIVIELTIILLTENFSINERKRQFSALCATSSMYFKETREILNDKLSDIILSQVKDENWDKVIIYLENITAWDNLNERCRLKAEEYINQVNIFETDKRSYEQLSQFSQSAISILIKASHIEFLRTAIINKLQKISLDNVLSLVKSYQDEIFQEKVLNPVLLKLSPQATIDQLLLIRSKTSLSSDNTIQTCLEDKMKSLSLEKLTSIAAKYYQDKWLINLIESNIEIKIPNSSLLDLLKAKSQYKSINEANPQIIELFDVYLPQKVEKERETLDLKFIVLIIEIYRNKIVLDWIDHDLKEKIQNANLVDLLVAKQSYKLIEKQDPEIIEVFDVCINSRMDYEYKNSNNNHFNNLTLKEITGLWDNFLSKYNEEIKDEIKYEVKNEFIRSFIKSKFSLIFDRFAISESWDSAYKNARILIEIVEYLDSKQWKQVFDAFCKNNQIHSSCQNIFKDLFKASLAINNHVIPDYWLDFRDQLNQLNRVDELKEMIDAYEERFGSSKDYKENQ